MKSKEARKYIFNSLDDIVHVSIKASFLSKRNVWEWVVILKTFYWFWKKCPLEYYLFVPSHIHSSPLLWGKYLAVSALWAFSKDLPFPFLVLNSRTCPCGGGTLGFCVKCILSLLPYLPLWQRMLMEPALFIVRFPVQFCYFNTTILSVFFKVLFLKT